MWVGNGQGLNDELASGAATNGPWKNIKSDNVYLMVKDENKCK